MTRIWSFVLLACLFFQTGCGADQGFGAKQERIADAVEGIPLTKVRLYLFSLDPISQRAQQIGLGRVPQKTDNVFHDYLVLGSVEIIPIQEKEGLIKAFAKGIRQSHLPSDCILEPRHGIRVVSDSSTNDFAICFKCGDVTAYGFAPAQSFTIGDARAVFDKFLDEYKIKKAE